MTAKDLPGEAWALPDAKKLTERGRYDAVVKVLDGASPQTRRGVIRWIVSAELETARDAYKTAFTAGEAYRAKLLRLAGATTKRAADVMDEHMRGLELAAAMTAHAVALAGSTSAAGDGLRAALEALVTLAGPWRDARAGAPEGHGIASLDPDESRVARLREESRRLHERWAQKGRDQ